MEKLKNFFESFIVIAILLVLVQTFLEDFAVLAGWNWEIRRNFIITGFIFDSLFTIEFLVRYFSAFGSESRFLAEFGIGTNSKLKRIELLPHDAKLIGMAHIGFGFNINWGGYNGIPMHEECVLYKPTIKIDGITIVEKGKLKFQ